MYNLHYNIIRFILFINQSINKGAEPKWKIKIA